ncbi:MAG: type III pantothenate kinase [Alphaproteobacteria bacterium]|nr:type III pantothenate kinase [Alphaproteobacteria bacterium]
MLLAIDCGNTNTVFAVYDGSTQRGAWRLSTDAHRTADEYAVWLTQFMALAGLKSAAIDAAVIATVVPAAKFPLKTLCRTYFKAEPLIVGEPGVKLGIAVAIDRPEQVGADRLVNAVAAQVNYPGDAIVIDFGTATTFDVVGADGSYQGGAIAPGVNLSVDALYRASAQLPRVAVERPQRVIGKATVPAMQSGVFWGYVALIEGLVARIRAEYGKPMRVIATGGLAPLFAGATSVIDAEDPDLTLSGLVEIHRRNPRA